ncbi:MAG: phospholipase D family protein [Planctomycetota bacterium]
MRCRWLLLALAFAACAAPDFDVPREPSYALDPGPDTRAKRDVDTWLARNPGPSGFYPLVEGTDSLGARLRMMEAAERTIDAQYFLMKSDSAGFVFAAALLAAADRGVRVRLLLDDIFTTIRDEEIAFIDAHPNVELRLYNPISRNGIGAFNFLGDFKRANRRMHNKSFIVDNQVAIVGGRNIADEYFDLRAEGEFLDLDVLAVGPIVAEVSTEFDSYWNHERSLPASAVVREYTESELERLRDRMNGTFLDEAETIYRDAIDSNLMGRFVRGEEDLLSADARLLTDGPDKLVRDRSPDEQALVRELAEACNEARSEIIALTPYFVPLDEGVAFWKRQVDRGVRVVVITNSLASNNHTAVQSAYSGYRKDLLRAGVELYEARAGALASSDHPGSLTLHTKAMVLDRERVFIGSLNLDPRSIEINSEMGLLIDSPELGSGLVEALFSGLDTWTYRVELNERGSVEWNANIDGEAFVTTTEPDTSWCKRCIAWFLKIVPDRQL